MGQDSSKPESQQSKSLSRGYTTRIDEVFVSAQAGNVEILQAFLLDNPAENSAALKEARNEQGKNLLMVVCTSNRHEHKRWNAQQRAKCDRGRLQVVKFLLQNYREMFDINETAPALPDPPTCGIDHRRHDPDALFEFLGNDLTALGFACTVRSETCDIVEALLLEGADPSVASASKGVTPLILASAAQFPKAVAGLLATGKVDPSCADRVLKQTPLHYLCDHGNIDEGPDDEASDAAVECAQLLVAAGADREAVDATVNTPLLRCIFNTESNSSCALLRYFLKIGCDFYSQRQYVREYLRQVHTQPNTRIRRIFDRQCDCEVENSTVVTLLLPEPMLIPEPPTTTAAAATTTAKHKPLQLETSSSSSTKFRLHEAVLFGSVGVLECVLQSGVNADELAWFSCDSAMNNEGDLDFILRDNNKSQTPSRQQFTSLQLACSLASRQSASPPSSSLFDPCADDFLAVEMARRLISAGASVNFCSSPSTSSFCLFSTLPPLCIAAANRVDSRALMKLLVDEGKTEVSSQFPSCITSGNTTTALEIAVKYNNFFVTDFLVNAAHFHFDDENQYDKVQRLIHVTETNFKRSVADLKCTSFLRRPFFTGTSKAYDATNLKFISMLLPPRSLRQEVVIAPTLFEPRVASIAVETASSSSSSTSKLIIKPVEQQQGQQAPLDLDPAARVKRILYTTTNITDPTVRKRTDEKIAAICSVPDFVEGYTERIRKLLQETRIAEPTSDDFVRRKVALCDTPFSKEDIVRDGLASFFSKYDPAVLADSPANKEKFDQLVRAAMERGEDAIRQRLESFYRGAEPVFSASRTHLGDAKSRIEKFYSHYDPSRLGRSWMVKVLELISKEGEEEVMRRLVTKFGPEPDWTGAGEAAAKDPILGTFCTHDFSATPLGAHFPDASTAITNLQSFRSFFFNEFRTLIQTFEPSSLERASLPALVLVLQNSSNDGGGDDCAAKCSLMRAYYRQWRSYRALLSSPPSSITPSASSSKLSQVLSHIEEECPHRLHEVFSIWKSNASLDCCLDRLCSTFSLDVRRPPLSCDEQAMYYNRVAAMFAKYAPEKGTASYVELVMDKYAGQELDLLHALVDKYGPEPVSSARARLVRFYEKYAPCNLSKIDKTLTEFAGREEELFSMLQGKYGPEPPATIERAPPLKPRDPFALEGNDDSDFLGLVTPSPCAVSRAFKQRTTTVLQKHRPADLPLLVDQLLPRYVGDEMTLVNAVVKRCGLEKEEWSIAPDFNRRRVTCSPTLFCASQSRTFKERLTRFYDQYAPDKLPTVDAALEKYLGAEDQLMLMLENKYGPESDVVDRLPVQFVNCSTPNLFSLKERIERILLKKSFSETGSMSAWNALSSDEKKQKISEAIHVAEDDGAGGKILDAGTNVELTFEQLDAVSQMVARVCLRYKMDEPAPAAPLKRFLLPELEMPIHGGVVLDVKVDSLVDRSVNDKLFIRVSVLVKPSDLLTDPEKSLLETRTFTFACAPLPCEADDHVQPSLTSEFSL